MIDLTRDFFEVLVKDYFDRKNLEYNPNIFQDVYYDIDRVSVLISKSYLKARDTYFTKNRTADDNKSIDKFVLLLYALEVYIRTFERYPYNTFKQFRFIFALLDIKPEYKEEHYLYRSFKRYSERYLIGRLTVNRIVISASFKDKLKDIFTVGSVNYVGVSFIKENFYKIISCNDMYDLYNPIDRISDSKDKLFNIIDEYTDDFYKRSAIDKFQLVAEHIKSIMVRNRNIYNTFYNLDGIKLEEIDVEEIVQALVSNHNYLEVVE